MPFGYLGAKHGLARFYPPPQHDVIIEPFAGAAGYACYWARNGWAGRVILIDANPRIVELWHRLQAMTKRQLMAIPDPVKGERTDEVLIAMASGGQGMAVLNGKTRQVTDRMVSSWPRLRSRLLVMLPIIKDWTVTCVPYSKVSNLKATWFIDPPYEKKLGADGIRMTAGGASYTDCGGVGFDDHENLAAWCKSRKGQVIVCEQMPAHWLPFKAFRNQRNGVGAGTQSTRTEAIWTNT